MKTALDKLLKHPRIWRAGSNSITGETSVLASGFKNLDRHLPNKGWPLGALTEILSEGLGIGELRVLMPALSKLTKDGFWVAWIAPPYVPYAPALTQHDIDLSRMIIVQGKTSAEHLWAAEQILRDEHTGAVLLWSYPNDGRKLRRLQLAAERGRSWGVLLGETETKKQDSPVALRLKMTVQEDALQAVVLKCRGVRPSIPIKLGIG